MAAIKVMLQVYLCAGIEIDLSLLVALAEYYALSLLHINIGSVEIYQFAHTHSRRSQQVNNCQVSYLGATITQHLQALVAQHLLN